ncbi:hypothetical protein EBB07_00955 [Paenibacillaceae bacterium]|nr:hypothetical protein EBB07_00955 [Paenibacillaceae bacterium]
MRIVLKGDIVRTKSGMTGEIVEVWGIARTFFRFRPEEGKSVPIMEKDISEIVERPVKRSKSRAAR